MFKWKSFDSTQMNNTSNRITGRTDVGHRFIVPLRKVEWLEFRETYNRASGTSQSPRTNFRSWGYLPAKKKEVLLTVNHSPAIAL